MLDERGAEWNRGRRSDETLWGNSFGLCYEASYFGEKYLSVNGVPLTPAQAIEATLGGTCRRVLYKLTNVLVCSECGAGMPKQLDKYCLLHFCPNCGREVVE